MATSNDHNNNGGIKHADVLRTIKEARALEKRKAHPNATTLAVLASLEYNTNFTRDAYNLGKVALREARKNSNEIVKLKARKWGEWIVRGFLLLGTLIALYFALFGR